ncbi:MAG: sugar kinase [Candidatus Cloacimonetes bacterium]|nr:sugar kinase [Candidatus Cloacimonadota bacterium]MBT7469373.1 sugar kinase [Candidatus Cloacimonadota bacterium]
MSLVIVGSVALDSVKTPFGSVKNALGGSAVYASMASKNFCQTHIVGVVGNDFPKEHINLLESNKISTTGLEFANGNTFKWKGVYNDLNKAETLDTQLNVFADFNPKIPENYQKCKYLFLGNIHPKLQLEVLQQMKSCQISACDTMNYWISSKRDKLLKVIEKVDILFINENEIKMLTDEQNIFIAAQKTQEMGAKLIIVKRGEYGAVAIMNDFIFFTPIFPVKKVIDPTGAGDSFAGGFMGYLSQQNKFDETTIKNAMIYGTITASFNVEDFSLNKLQKIDFEMIEKRKEAVKKSVVF